VNLSFNNNMVLGEKNVFYFILYHSVKKEEVEAAAAYWMLNKAG
jgi:hypothetical protein